MPAETAFIDSLTGLYSRAALNQRLQEEIERARRYQEDLSLILLDVDHFKSVNDAFGHLRGDQVLCEFGGRLASLVRSSDLVFRYGGDEFVILLPHTEKEQAAHLAQRLLDEIREVPFIGTPPLTISISLGITSFPGEAATAQALFESADRRHYHAKHQGRGRLCSEDPASEATPLVAEVSRLVERDLALKALHDLLAVLPQHKRGVLEVQGPSGSGKSRFLREVHQAARLQGYVVLHIQGRTALRNRLYGVFSEVLQERDLPSPWDGPETFSAAVVQWINDKDSAGLLVTIDEVSDVDQATLEFWRDIFFAPHIPRLVLAYSTGGPATRPGLHLDAPAREVATLEPLSPEGVRIWVRHSLQWEAPQEFITWLHRETGGWPKHIHHGLVYLIAQEHLKRSTSGWRVDLDMRQVHLAAWLEQQFIPPPHNLPAGLSEFVGRDAELITLRRLLQEQSLTTLLGPGGIGKSRLAIQAAAESLEAFPHGVFFVPLASVTQTSSIAPAIADVLHYSFSGSQDPQEQLLAYLRSKEMLLALDNFEQLGEGAAFVARLREQAPGVHLLVTSRERLDLPDEAVCELQGLPYPPGDSLEQLRRYTSVQLFLSSARRAKPDFMVNAENAAAVAHICQLVEGMPLGIELAAAWLGSFSPQEIVSHIEHTLSFLYTDQVSIPERHRSLLAIFDSFWDLLSEGEQSTLRQMAVFRGGFRAEAGRLVAGASPFFLDGLVSKAYLRRTPHGRYEMHQLLWQYASEKLSVYPDEAEEASHRHSDYFTLFIQQREHLIASDRQVLEEISTEIENLRSAWEWGVINLRVAYLARSAGGLSQYFSLVGLFQVGETLFQKAVERLRNYLGKERLQPAADQARLEMQRLLSRLLISQASFLKGLGISTHAGPLIQEALAIAQLSQDAGLEALAMTEWGRALMVQDLKEARAKVEQALSILRQNWPDGLEPSSVAAPEQHFILSLEAQCQRLLGVAAARGDNTATAREYFESALKTQRLLVNLDEESSLLNDLGLLADMDGRCELARDYFLQALQIKQTLGNQAGVGKALHNLGFVSSHLGDYQQARRHYEQALAIWQDTGNWSSEGVTLNNLSEIAFLQGDVVRALEYAQRAINIHRQSGNRSGQGEAHEALADVFLYLGYYQQAEADLGKAQTLFIEAGDVNNQVSVMTKLGLLSHYLGDDETAIQTIQQAVQRAEELGNQSFQATAQYHLGQVFASAGQLDQAVEAYRQALHLRTASMQEHLALEPVAGLAQVACQRGDLNRAVKYVDHILDYLARPPAERKTGHPLDGVADASKIYLVCYRVLDALGDSRAGEILEQGRAWLLERANWIVDELMRHSYLETIPAHQEILAVTEQAQKLAAAE
jgi:diguanylate cyclase (GGDEF)-like protein